MESIVLSEVSRFGPRLSKRRLDSSRGLFGDVLIERTRRSASRDDALDGRKLDRAEVSGVSQRAVERFGGVSLSEKQDLSCLSAPDAWGALAHQAKELGGALAHALEGEPDLIEVDRALALWLRMEPGGVQLEPRAAGGELVARDAPQIRRVHEQLALRDAHREDVGDVIVRDRVAIAAPRDEAVDAAETVDDARGVVDVPRQRHQVLALLVEALQCGAFCETPMIYDRVEPVRELRPHIIDVLELTAVEERALDLPK